ncbi:MAG: glutamine synthetase beta-grasp domain-containing protein [Planctomycetota bacterium]
MSKAKLEYIWLDGYTPTQSLRSKTKIVSDFGGKLEDCPQWCFDGSSTEQAEGNSSDCLLEPVALFEDPQRLNGWLVMCEVLNPDGTPHASNGRATIEDDDNDFWFGFEQEYFLWDVETNRPPGFPTGGYPEPQGPYYCSVGAANAHGRHMIEEHLDCCLDADINVEGINAEVAAGQWEFQVFSKGAKQAGDQVWMARYLLERIGEKYGYGICWHPKPLGDTDWNGSGMHANFSNSVLRDCGDQGTYEKVCQAFEPRVEAHIAVYGADNDQRLTGKHETQRIDQFSYGVSDRGASIRIPVGTVTNGWKGWLEDRRPASNADPYKVAAEIIKTVKSAAV